MSAVEDPDFNRFEKVKGRRRRTFKSQMIDVATPKKSRVWSLNGKAFSWKDQPGYKLAYFKTVAECFKPHFEAINIAAASTSPPKRDPARKFSSSPAMSSPTTKCRSKKWWPSRSGMRPSRSL